MSHSQNSSSSNPVANSFAKISVTGFELLSKLTLWPKSSRQNFHPFSRFPTETRLKIWKLAIPDKLIIILANGIHDNDDQAEREYSEFLVKTVRFARICRDARSVIVDFPYTPMPPMPPRLTKDPEWWDCSIIRYLLNIESWKITFRNSNLIIRGRRISNTNENLAVDPMEPV